APSTVLSHDQPLGDEAAQYSDRLNDDLEAEQAQVQRAEDFRGDPLAASGLQSADNKAAYVQVYLAGNQGESLANESVQAVRDVIDKSTPPPGLKAYVTGPTPLSNDQHHAGDKSVKLITAITMGVILIMLLFVYTRL